MDYRRFLILFCVIGISFGGYCRKLKITEFFIGYSETLYCSRIEESVYMPTGLPIFNPEKIDIVHSFIEVLRDSYFSGINMIKATSLRIESSTIGAIEDNAFKTTLESIKIVETEIKHLSPLAFNSLPKLKILDLNHCHLSTINLNGTNSLQWLELSFNNLTKIPAVNCQQLQYMLFQNNKITDISQIENCTNLLVLDLQVNRVNNMTKEHLKNLKNLLFMNASSNPLFKNNNGEVPIDLFQNNLMLETLGLEDTGITIIRNGTFSNLNNLKRLLLDRNNLMDLPEGIFSDLNLLTELILHTNKIKTIHSTEIFFGLEKLVSLDLSNNVLEHIVHDAFSYMTSLETLHLQNNKLNFLNSKNLPGSLSKLNINENAFKRGALLLNSLQWLDLSFNNLTKIPAVNCQQLQSIHLNNNEITDISQIENCTNLRTLYFQMNRVNNITKEHLKKLNKLEVLEATSNPLFKSNDREIPIDLFQNNLKLRYVDLEDTGITIIRNGTFSSLSNLVRLWLGRNNLIRLPEAIFSDLNSLTDLNLRANKIKAIQSQEIFFGLKKLRILDLSNNILEHIVHDAFSHLTSLRLLVLQNNRLTFLNFKNLPSSLIVVDINENAFKCGDLLNIVKTYKNILSFGTSTNTTNIKKIRCYE